MPSTTHPMGSTLGVGSTLSTPGSQGPTSSSDSLVGPPQPEQKAEISETKTENAPPKLSSLPPAGVLTSSPTDLKLSSKDNSDHKKQSENVESKVESALSALKEPLPAGANG